MNQVQQLCADLFPQEGAQRAAAKDKRFVHYTTADVARSIIEKRQVWMRNTRTMNDFREIRHGIECLERGIASPQGQALHSIIHNINGEGLKSFSDEGYIKLYKNNTYITCISEHEDTEDGIGRLSMWRAYGGTSGVAVVVKNTPFIEPNDYLGAWTFPVTYCGTDGYISKFQHMHDHIKANYAYFQQHRNMAFDYLNMFLLYLILCTKHPGFAEEREWRVVCNHVGTNPHIKKSIQSVRGTPQLVFTLPLENIPAIKFNASIPDFLDHLIIGPTTHPEVRGEAFVDLLVGEKIPGAAHKVRLSDIPLRHYL